MVVCVSVREEEIRIEVLKRDENETQGCGVVYTVVWSEWVLCMIAVAGCGWQNRKSREILPSRQRERVREIYSTAVVSIKPAQTAREILNQKAQPQAANAQQQARFGKSVRENNPMISCRGGRRRESLYNILVSSEVGSIQDPRKYYS
jgi:hypothetical protein